MIQQAKLQHYLDAMARRGFSAPQVLEGTGLSVADLEANAVSPGLAESQLIIHNMLELTGNEALGLELGQETRPSDMGVVGHGMIAAPTFRHTIMLWSAHAPALFGPLLQVSLSEEPSLWRMHLSGDMPPGRLYRFCLEEFLALTAKLGRQMVGKPVRYGSVDLAYAEPPHHDQYRALFHCDIHFDAPRTSISVLSPRLDDFIETRDEYLFPIYQHYCERQSRQDVDEASCAFRVHNYLLKRLGAPASLAAMAREERCSSSTLRRRLREEGHSFRGLRNQFRRDFAEEYLKSTTLSAKEVAYLLGYRDTKPFLRAFRLWTGLTVGEYKRRFGVRQPRVSASAASLHRKPLPR